MSPAKYSLDRVVVLFPVEQEIEPVCERCRDRPGTIKFAGRQWCDGCAGDKMTMDHLERVVNDVEAHMENFQKVVDQPDTPGGRHFVWAEWEKFMRQFGKEIRR